MVVRDSLGCPQGSGLLAALSAAVNLEQPGFFLVDDGEALSPVPIAVFLCKASHQAYGIASRRAPLKGYSLQFLYLEHSVLVYQFSLSVRGGFSHCQLLLVHARVGHVEELERFSLRCRNASFENRIPQVKWLFGVQQAPANLVLAVCKNLPRLHSHPGPVVGITRVGCHHRPVIRSQPAHHNRCAAFLYWFIFRKIWCDLCI